jgi:erythritol transport system ATP-binding protein
MTTASQIAPPAADVVLAARNIAKIYGGTYALKGVNFDIRRGKVTALFGENGAGKSTLMKVLSGVITPTSGSIELDGGRVAFNSSTEARDLGISIIHQELSLAPNLSVRDNIFMGRELRTPTGVDFAEEARQARALIADLEEEIDPLTLVEELRLGQQQIVEIARALSVNSRILIMDEPTSALSATEVEVLFRVIRDLSSRGVSIVYISHHLEEALQITDYAVVLRDGAITATAEAKDIDLEWIVRHMVGENFNLGSPRTNYAFGEVALSIDDVSVADPSNADNSLVDHMSFDVRAGEIVCIYGLMGAGRTELLECVAGRVPMTGGRILIGGEEISKLSIAERIEKGLALVPEDRQRDGLVQTMTVGENLSLASIGAFVKGMLLSRTQEREIVNRSIRNVRIKTEGGSPPIGSLSGGNQQKVVIGKVLATGPKVILLDEPNRGIDVGAKAEVVRLLSERAAQGLAVVFSTSEVAECLSIAHRVIVMRRGKISAQFGSNVTKEEIMAASGEALVSKPSRGAKL